MRVMDALIEDHGLEEELEERIVAETGNSNFWLWYSESMDADSDDEEEDPEAVLRKEVGARAYAAGRSERAALSRHVGLRATGHAPTTDTPTSD